MYPGSCAGALERRREQENEPVGFTHEPLVGRAHRDARATSWRSGLVGRAGRAERTAHDCAIESMRHSRSLPSRGASRRRERRAGTRRRPTRTPSIFARSDSARLRHARGVDAARSARRRATAKRVIVAREKPAEPDALAAPLRADAVHAVVPVAVPHQREAVAPSVAARSSARRQCSKSEADARRRVELRVPVVLVRPQGLARQERHRLRENRRVARGEDVLRRRRTGATPCRRSSAFARRGRRADATSAGRRPPRTGAWPLRGCARARARAPP